MRDKLNNTVRMQLANSKTWEVLHHKRDLVFTTDNCNVKIKVGCGGV